MRRQHKKKKCKNSKRSIFRRRNILQSNVRNDTPKIWNVEDALGGEGTTQVCQYQINTDFSELKVQYEQKRLALLVVKLKLMMEQGSVDAWITDMHKELAAMSYQVSMAEDKVQQILKAHKLKTLKLVAYTLDKG